MVLTKVVLMLLSGWLDPECADGMLGRAHTLFFPDFEMVVGKHGANGANINTRTHATYIWNSATARVFVRFASAWITTEVFWRM